MIITQRVRNSTRGPAPNGSSGSSICTRVEWKRCGFRYNLRSETHRVSIPLKADSSASPVSQPKHRAFTSFANVDFRIYLFSATAAMMADNVEHVISYWVIFQKFHSPALGGFAVISHWVPYLFFAGYSGALADRFDIRRLIQTGMLMLLGVSVCWGWMFLTDSVALWKAMVLLVIHGFAGVLWIPASQVLINQIVTSEQLPSAVRLSATGRYLGFLVAPRSAAGCCLFWGLITASYERAHLCADDRLAHQRALWTGGRQLARAGRSVERLRRCLVDDESRGSQSHTVVNDRSDRRRLVLRRQRLSSANAGVRAGSRARPREDFSYMMLLGADAAGGLIGGLLLESRAMLEPRVRTAFILAMIWCCALVGFARSNVYALAVCLLFVAGFVELAFNSMAQALVQMNAPAEIRGRVIGVFSMSAMGMRTFSGLSVGLLGASVGIHNSLALSAAGLFVLIAVLFAGRHFRRA